MNEEEENHQRCTSADDAVPASCENDPPQPLAAEIDSVSTDMTQEKDLAKALQQDGDNGPPDPIPIQQQEQLAFGDEEVEEHESALSIVEEDSDRAPIPIQQQEQQLNDAKRKAKAEISTANGARGGDERDSTKELVAEEMEEDLKPSTRSGGAFLGESGEEEAPSMSTPRLRSRPSLCLADCDVNDPPVPIQQQEQLLALDDKAVKNKEKQEAKAEEQKYFVDEEGSDRATILAHQQMQTTPELSTANGASGMDEKDSATEPTIEEMEEGDVNLRPAVRSRVGASLGELEEGYIEVTTITMPTQNDAANNRFVMHTVWTRLQTLADRVRNNWKQILRLTILLIASAIIVGIVWGGRRNKSSAELIYALVITFAIIVGIIFVALLGTNICVTSL